MKKYQELVHAAIKMRKYSYAPYSHFTVGAALLSKDGNIFTGCNIENASYSPTICAERVAFFKAISEGEKEFEAIAIVGGKENEKPNDYCAPCGVCRQVMNEFCDGDFKIILVKNENDISIYNLLELLPKGFGPHNLSK